MKTPEVCLIVVASDNNVIGLNNSLPWQGQVSEDMKMFRSLTMGHPVIMGRRTWESIPEKFRPLPGRTNIVLTRQKGYTHPSKETHFVRSFEDAMRIARKAQSRGHIFIIGGESVYREAIEFDWVDRIFLTRIHREFDGDAFLPEYFPTESELQAEETVEWGNEKGLKYTFFNLKC